MTLKKSFECNECKKPLPDRFAIFKNASVGISFLNAKGERKERWIDYECKNYHFCSLDCGFKYGVREMAKLEPAIQAEIERSKSVLETPENEGSVLETP